jgi:hypothetical protein
MPQPSFYFREKTRINLVEAAGSQETTPALGFERGSWYQPAEKKKAPATPGPLFD